MTSSNGIEPVSMFKVAVAQLCVLCLQTAADNKRHELGTDTTISLDNPFNLISPNPARYKKTSENTTHHHTSPNVTLKSSLSTGHDVTSHNSKMIFHSKITLLLVLTAVMLIFSYKFVVRLFLGYADRTDDVMPDVSDDEDSAVIKRGPVDGLDMW